MYPFPNSAPTGRYGLSPTDSKHPVDPTSIQTSLADSVLIRICNTLIKVAFLLSYLRLFRPVTHIKIMVWVGIVALVTFCIVFVIVDVVACSPWPSEKDGWLNPVFQDRCNRIVPDMITAGAYFSVITDFYILFIPLHQVPKLALSFQKKIGISFIFLTGLM